MTPKKNILLLYYVPSNTIKFKHWIDGFTSAIDIISTKYNILKYNLAEKKIPSNYFEQQQIDLILVKSNWSARIDRYMREEWKDLTIKKGLLISGSKPPPSKNAMQYYDLLFYETEWYKKCINTHPNKYHAFGVNTDIMRPLSIKKDIDWLSVGMFKEYKRQHLLLNKKGKKVVIGEVSKSQSIISYFMQEKRIVRKLKKNGIKIVDFMPHDDLCTYYNRAKKVYIPAKTQGGGERAILEARACGTPVEIENDNPKLATLINSDIYSHNYYASQLEIGINNTI